MEGLEISEIRFSYLNKYGAFRFDSGYYNKEYLNDESIIQTKKYSTLKEIAVDLKSFGAYSLNNEVVYKTEGVPFVRGINMKGGRISFNNMIYIDETANSLLWKSEVKPETVLLSMSGTIGDVAIASKNWKYPINSNQDIAKIDTKGKINPYYLYVFLTTKFGQNYLKREARGSVQQHVFLSQMEQFEIPLFHDDFVHLIQKIIEISDDTLFKSQDYYGQAESILLEAVGLKEFEPSKEPVNIKSFKNSFLSTGRLDAEYYQKKYEDYLKLIRSYPNGFENLETACELKDINFNLVKEIEYQYVELSNIGKAGQITGCTIALGEELPGRARRKITTNDVVISSIEGSLGSCAIVSDEYNNSLCSTGFYVINSKKINSETLLVLFKSEPMQNILKQNCSGTILTAINKTEFLNIPVPLIDKAVQKSIQVKVIESMELKKQSEYLLNFAKKAVEIAIEKNEETALAYIRKESHEYL